MWISVNATFTLKNKSKSYRGITSEYWNFAKEKPLNFDILVAVFTAKLAEFYLDVFPELSIEEMNNLIQNSAEQIKTIKFEENIN